MSKSSGKGDGGKNKKAKAKKTPAKKKTSKRKSPPKPKLIDQKDLPDSDSWERLPNEPNLWYERFVLFRNRGPERRMLDVFRLFLRQNGDYEKADKVVSVDGAWSRAAREWHWKLRSEQWDEEQQKKREQRNDRVLRELELKQIDLGHKALKKVSTMLDWPLTEQTISDDGKTTVIKPAGWNFATIPKLLREAALQIQSAVQAPPVGAQERAGARQGSDSGDAPDGNYIPEEAVEWLFHEYLPPEEAPKEAT